MIKVKKMHPDAKLPVRNFSSDAGSDIFSVEDVTIYPNQYKFVDTGIALQVVNGDNPILTFRNLEGATDWRMQSYIRIAPKSGIAFKNGIQILAGVVDVGYTDSLKVGIYNGGDMPFNITSGMKIAQIIREVCFIEDFVEFDDFDETDRGTGGFGSTGNGND